MLLEIADASAFAMFDTYYAARHDSISRERTPFVQPADFVRILATADHSDRSKRGYVGRHALPEGTACESAREQQGVKAMA